MTDDAHRLAGTWSFERCVSSGGGIVASMDGTATIGPTPEPGVLAYREAGEVAPAGAGVALAATRAHAIRVRPGVVELHVGAAGEEKGDNLLYRFAWPSSLDSRAAYPILSSSLHEHRCGLDTYHAWLCILSPDSLRLTERVRGPRKGYAITTEFRRLA